jgi:Putative transposase of IS4/5 family (DUF4096)
MKTAFQKKKEAKQQAALESHKTKARLGLGPTQPLRGATPSPLAATTSKRKVTPPANLRPHPGFGTGQRPHACSQVEARGRGDGGNGAPWRDLPDCYGPCTTCYNRFVRWRRAEVWGRIMDALAAALEWRPHSPPSIHNKSPVPAFCRTYLLNG